MKNKDENIAVLAERVLEEVRKDNEKIDEL